MRLVNAAGIPVGRVNFTRLGTGSQFTARFTPPASPFRFQLMGNTTKSMPFQRINKDGPITARPAVVYYVPGREDGRLKLGMRSFLIFKLFNAGPRETFAITIQDSLGFLKVKFVKSTMQSSQRSLLVSIKPTREGGWREGDINAVSVMARGRTSGVSWKTF